MEKVKFSLILNSRLRVPHLIGLFDSIVKTTKNLNDIEVLVSFDNDDFDSVYFLSVLKNAQHPILDVLRFYFIDRERNLIKRFNKLAKLSNGKYIFVLNDDARIITQDWDGVAYHILEKSFDDGIVYGGTTCNSVDRNQQFNYSSFPIISKKACDIAGFFMPDCITTLGGDVVVYRVYKTIDRTIEIPVSVRHVLHETVERVINCDAVAAEMRNYQNTVNPFTIDISPYIQNFKSIL